jgi:hypothetical protein
MLALDLTAGHSGRFSGHQKKKVSQPNSLNLNDAYMAPTATASDMMPM